MARWQPVTTSPLNFDRFLARIARPSVVLRIATLAYFLMEFGSLVTSLRGGNSEPYDGLLAQLYRRGAGHPQDPALVISCFVLFCGFIALFWQAAQESSLDRPRPRALLRIIWLDALAWCITPALPFLVTVLASVRLRLRPAFFFAVSQVVIRLLLYTLLPSETEWQEQHQPNASMWALLMAQLGAFVGLYAMAFGIGRLLANEVDKRRWLQVMLAEKTSGEALQAEQLRYAERMMMARELHDVMGHHLTALNLQLQLSEALLKRQDADGAAQAVARAREGAAHLLADVRAAVSAERASNRIDLREALQALALGIASTDIQLELDEVAQDLGPRTAHALLRCVQEAVTNSVRHARAQHITIRLRREGEGDAANVCVSVEDDGPGAPRLREGNGLKGMQERMAELGGSFSILKNGPGFMVEWRVPRKS